MPSPLDQTVARCESILAQCLVAANQAAAAAAAIGAAGLAPLESPAFTGNPTAPTPAIGDSSNSISTSAFLARLLGVPSGIAQLDATGLIPVSQLPFSGLTFDGVWNAATNSPTLSSSSGTAGHFLVVQVSGSTTLNGISTWSVGDQALFNGLIWQRVPFTAPPILNLPLSSLAAQGSATIVGNITGGSASPSAITISSITSYLSTMVGATGSTTGVVGLVPAAPSGGTGFFLRSDGVWGSIGSPDLSAYALLANPAFTGTATAATQARNNMGSALATTQFVVNQQAQATEASQIQVNGTASAGTSTYGAKIDHIHGTDLSRAATNYAGFQGHLWGLGCSNGTANVNLYMDIALGSAMDATNAQMMALGTAFTKKFDTTWVQGSSQGGFASGESLPVSGTFHVWLIAGASGTGVDVLANNNAISGLSPALPAGYVFKRRIMSMKTDGSQHILRFTQTGDQFDIAAVITATPSSPYGMTLTAVGTPAGIGVLPKFNANLVCTGAGATLVIAPAANSVVSVGVLQVLLTGESDVINVIGPPTNTNAQIFTSIISGGAFTSSLGSSGWLDSRGRI